MRSSRDHRRRQGRAASRGHRPEAPGASVNICRREAGTLGVRVSAVPWHDLAPWVQISVEYYSTRTAPGTLSPRAGTRGGSRSAVPAPARTRARTFSFLAPESGHRLLMRGIAQVEWRGGRTGEASTLATAPCEVSSDGTSSTSVQTRSRTITIRNRPVQRKRASGKRGKQPRVVRDNARHPQRLETARWLEVVDSPDEKLAAGAVNGADQAGSDQPPVGHERVTTALARCARAARPGRPRGRRQRRPAPAAP